MAEAPIESSEDPSEETEELEPLEPEDSGTFQQVSNLLDIMDSESTKTDTAGAGPDMRKMLASVIITEKATTKPPVVMNALIRCLQVPEISTQRRINIYSVLQGIIQQEGELEERCVQRLVAVASREMRGILETEDYVRAEVASDTLVALSRNHFSLVMYELQHHLKPLNLTEEFVIITLAKLANGNVFEFMPYMGITLATVFTMLRLATEAKMRQVICSAMETFCETVQFYLRHLEDSVYPVMTEEQFAVKLFPMYRYFVTVWLRNHDPEVKLGVIKSLKPMLSLLLPNDDLREQVYDYVPLLLAEYQGISRRSPASVPHPLQVLRQILEMSVTTNTPIPPMQLHTVFTELHVQVCSKAPTQQQYSSQNLTEIVHCFIALARSYPKELMKFFLSQMEMSKEAIRVGTLNLIRAVVSADEPRMSIRTICLATRVVKNTLSDTRSKVRMAILRIIGQLALSGFQDRIKGWGLKYVSVQLTLSTYKLTNRRESCYQRDLEEKMVHKVTMDTVRVVTSSVSGTTHEFWVRLLCYIMETDYTEALTPICVSLTNLAERQLHTKDEEANATGTGRHVDLPAPQKLLARLLVLMSSPYKGEGRGIAMLNLLRTLSQSIAPSMADTWELEIPLLVRYLEEHTEFTWNQKTWEDKLIQFLRNSLKKTRGSSWGLRLSKELNNQIESFDSPSLEKVGSQGQGRSGREGTPGTVAGESHAGCDSSCRSWPLPPSVTHLHRPDWPLTTPLVTSSFPSKLRPFYSAEENSELMDIGIHSIISLQPPGEDNESIKTLYVNALHALEQLMEGLVQRQLDPKGLQAMVHLLEKWILSEREWEREKAMNLHLRLMQIYVQSIGVCIPLKLGQFGTLVGLIAPRTCDSHRRTRLASMDVLSSLLDLHASQTCSSWGASKELELEKCKEALQGSDVEEIISASSRIAKVACLQFNCDEVVSLIQKLCENIGAMDLQHDKASVTWIGTFLQMRVKELEDKVAEVLGAILVHLPMADQPEVRHVLIEGILLLAHHHQETVLTSLLRQPLPMESHLTEVWLAVAENVSFARTMLHGLMGRLQSRFTPRANAASKADIWRLAAVDPLMTLCTIHLLIEKMGDELPDLCPELTYTLLLQLSSSQGPEAVSPVLKTWRLVHTGTLPEEINPQRCSRGVGMAIKSMQLLLRRRKGELLLRLLEEQGVWTLLESSSTFLQGVSLLARLCLQNAEGYQQRLSELVLRAMASEVLSCRISSTAVCVEFMRDPILCREKLLKPAVLMLEKGVDQEDEALRVLSLRALGNMALGAPRKVRQYRKLLLEKCLCSLRGPVSTSVTSEGMEALAKVLAELREGDMGSAFDAISERCRAFFDNESELLRLKAFVLFGKLAKMVGISKKHFFKEEVKKAWVSLMLHCQDPCPDAAQACEATMSQCVRFWGWKSLGGSLDQSNATDAQEMTVFQMTLCSVLTQKKPAVLYRFLLKTMTYVKSNLPRIRIAACNLAGIIMKHMTAHYLKKLDFPSIRNSLQELQLDSDPGVWKAALETLKILDDCSQHWLLTSPTGTS
uniref:Maestro heat like repeat family member 2A n=1 Tax=Catagonus wagneri TaxID=51154 RepID=A0A8C3YTQ9_9CETA